MRQFWGIAKNEHYSVGCTGQTVCLCDASGAELAVFKDLKYAYTPMFSPKGDPFIVKSTAGWLAVYSLEPPKLVKKFKFSPLGAAQDEGCCFSPDGRLFFNIEKPVSSCETELTIYDTADFHVLRRLFRGERSIVLDHIEWDAETGGFYLLGFQRNSGGAFSRGFVARLVKDDRLLVKWIDEKDYDYIQAYKCLELRGFSPKAIQWSRLKNRELTAVRLAEIFETSRRKGDDYHG